MILHWGTDSVTRGPVLVIMPGTLATWIFTKPQIHYAYGLPEGSFMLVNEISYMDDATWVKVVEVLAPGIRKLSVIK